MELNRNPVNGRSFDSLQDAPALPESAFTAREHMGPGDTLHGAISRVKHEINNPLAIISGNAQLLAELVKALALGDDLMKPIQDIEEASRRIMTSLNKLDVLKDFASREYRNGHSP